MRKAHESYVEALRQITSYKYEGAEEMIRLLENNQNEERWLKRNEMNKEKSESYWISL